MLKCDFPFFIFWYPLRDYNKNIFDSKMCQNYFFGVWAHLTSKQLCIGTQHCYNLSVSFRSIIMLNLDNVTLKLAKLWPFWGFIIIIILMIIFLIIILLVSFRSITMQNMEVVASKFDELWKFWYYHAKSVDFSFKISYYHFNKL